MTVSRTYTYGREDIQRVYASFSADYRIVAEWTGLHSPAFVDETVGEILWLASEEYLREVHLQLTSTNGSIKEAAVFRVSTDAGSWSSDRPGDLYWSTSEGDRLGIVVFWSQQWLDLTPSERAALKAKHLPGWGESSFDGTYALQANTDRHYSSRSYGMERTRYSE